MQRLLLPSLITALLLGACSSSNNPTSTLPPSVTHAIPAVTKAYDPARGGLQITAIYYDQNKNLDSAGLLDEWIVLTTDHQLQTAGWMLNAGDVNQNYPLPDSIRHTWTIYTRQGPAQQSDSTQALNLNVWIWNNTAPDTARIFNELGGVMDSLSYDL